MEYSIAIFQSTFLWVIFFFCLGKIISNRKNNETQKQNSYLLTFALLSLGLIMYQSILASDISNQDIFTELPEF